MIGYDAHDKLSIVSEMWKKLWLNCNCLRAVVDCYFEVSFVHKILEQTVKWRVLAISSEHPLRYKLQTINHREYAQSDSPLTEISGLDGFSNVCSNPSGSITTIFSMVTSLVLRDI